jgi:hypothetical protein
VSIDPDWTFGRQVLGHDLVVDGDTVAAPGTIPIGGDISIDGSLPWTEVLRRAKAGVITDSIARDIADGIAIPISTPISVGEIVGDVVLDAPIDVPISDAIATDTTIKPPTGGGGDIDGPGSGGLPELGADWDFTNFWPFSAIQELLLWIKSAFVV